MLEINEKDVWQRLKEDGKPIAVYGMGNAAEKIIEILHENEIEINEIFASDEFVRGHSFLGKKVLKYSEVCEKYDDFNIVLAFATRLPDVLERIKAMNAEHHVFAPDIPVAGNGLFTGKYFDEHRAEFQTVYDNLADDESRRVYENVLKFKISGKVDYLYKCNEYDKGKIYTDILRLGGNETMIDCGAYDGDTIREFTASTGGKYNHIYALEPDGKNFKKLCRNTDGMQGITLYNAGAWCKSETLFFEKKAGRNSKLSSVGEPTEFKAIDDLIDDNSVSLIKMDIEGAEMSALCGCEKTIKRCLPKLYICAYHRNEDMFALPQKIWELNKNYKIYFRHSAYIPAWESNFYCICNEKECE